VTPEEKTALNRRVAVAMRWSGLESADAYIAECWPDGLPEGEGYFYITDNGGWFGWPPGARRYETDCGMESPDKEPVPDFATDPAAADLVKAHMRAQGWHYRQGWGTDGAWAYVDTREPDYIIGESYQQEGESHALCLSFLAAHDAQEQEGEKP